MLSQKRELRELVKDAIPGDQLLFFCECADAMYALVDLMCGVVAGHVGQVDCEEDTEDDGLDEGKTFHCDGSKTSI